MLVPKIHKNAYLATVGAESDTTMAQHFHTGHACKRVHLKKAYPVRRWGAMVVSLPRHLRMHHIWSKHDSVTAVNKFALHISLMYTLMTVDSHRAGEYPVDDCSAVVKRLPPHIRYHHGVRDESVVKDLLRRARHSRSIFVEHVYHINNEEDVISEVDDQQDDEFDMTDDSNVEDAARTVVPKITRMVNVK